VQLARNGAEQRFLEQRRRGG